MAVFRVLLLLLLVGSGVYFVLYATTSQLRYRRSGLRLLAAALVAGFVFFAVLIVQRLAE